MRQQKTSNTVLRAITVLIGIGVIFCSIGCDTYVATSQMIHVRLSSANGPVSGAQIMFVDSKAISTKSSANQEFDEIRKQGNTNIAKTESDGLAAIRLNTAYIDTGIWSSRRPENDVVTNHTYIARVDGAKSETFSVNAIPGATLAASLYRVTVLSIDPPRWPH